MKKKLCKNCGKKFPADLDHFYRNGKWLSGYCKKCTLEVNAQWKKDHPEKNAEYNKRSANKNKARRKKTWRIASATYRSTHKEKVACRQAFRKAFNRREINPEPCEICGCKEVHGHHWSYRMEHFKDVRWLCIKCHARLHAL